MEFSLLRTVGFELKNRTSFSHQSPRMTLNRILFYSNYNVFFIYVCNNLCREINCNRLLKEYLLPSTTELHVMPNRKV